jgi:glycosyltransferase involved in cell wall biosynthesis
VKVVQVTTLFPPYFVGGASLVCYFLSRELVKRNHKVFVFTGRNDLTQPLFQLKNYSFHGIKVRSINISPFYEPTVRENYYNPRLDGYFREFLEELEPEIVHFHSIQGLGVSLIERAYELNLPILLTFHDWWWLCPHLFLVKPNMEMCPLVVDSRKCNCIPGEFLSKRREYLKNVLEKVDLIIVVSNYLKNSLVENGFDSTKIIVCENGISKDLSKFSPKPSSRLRFGYIGGSSKHKGVHLLFDACQHLSADTCVIKIYGAEDFIVTENPLINKSIVRLFPRFPHKALDKVLAKIDVLIAPSVVLEAFSLAVREAMLRGIPVISSSSGGPEEIIVHMKNGLIFERGDVDDLISKMNFVINNYPTIIDKFKNNIEVDKIVSLEAQVKKMLSIYARLRAIHQNKYTGGAYQINAEIMKDSQYFSDETHKLVRRKDGFTFYLDRAFLYILRNINSDSLFEETFSLFNLGKTDVREIIKVLEKTKLVIRKSG